MHCKFDVNQSPPRRRRRRAIGIAAGPRWRRYANTHLNQSFDGVRRANCPRCHFIRTPMRSTHHNAGAAAGDRAPRRRAARAVHASSTAKRFVSQRTELHGIVSDTEHKYLFLILSL
jgi:hypothetical protein